MVKATEKRIFLTRHAQAEHNVNPPKTYQIHDPNLTDLGRKQASDLNEATKDNIQATAELLVTSPLKRTVATTVIGYPVLRKRLEAIGKPIVVLPELQECNDLPCDRGSTIETLENLPDYAGLDLSRLRPKSDKPEDDWTQKKGFWAADVESLQNRARWVRRWLREQPEREIAVVSHADCLRYITEGRLSAGEWANTEVREYTFKVDEDEDVEGDAWMVRVQEIAREGENAPTSSAL